MTKDKWDKLKITSEMLKNNWPVIVLAFTALSSGVTNAMQYYTNTDLVAEDKAKSEQIAQIANHYAQPVKIERKIYKTDCGVCQQLKSRVEKLEKTQIRWH